MMDYTDSPVVVGSTGGSGSRVLSKICLMAGYYMGQNLNKALDSLDFKAFYDRWVNLYLSREGCPLTERQTAQMGEELEQCILNHRAAIADPRARWGWKTPRSMFVLPFLHERFSGLKFIHLIRDGRDMAYSKNQKQLKKHGQALLGRRWKKAPSPDLSILVWQAINMSAAKYGESVMGDRYLRIRFEDLCTQPEASVKTLLDFLDSRDLHIPTLTREIKPPESIGRWRNQPQREVMQVVELGRPGLELFGYV